MRVISNAQEDCTGGEHIMTVNQGDVINVKNIQSTKCPLEVFEALTLDALFTRIWDECIYSRSLRRPFPVGNITYDRALGFPRMLYTHGFSDSGLAHPVIHVKEFVILD